MVILTLKNLQQQTFNVEIDLSASVRELKEKIEKENGSDYPAEGQKLIYAGKILDDDSNLESYKIDAKKFLVIMVSKPKAPPPSSAPADPTIVSEDTSTSTEDTSRTEEAAAAATTTALTTTTTSTSQSTTTSTNTTTTTTTTSSSGTGGGVGGGGSAGSTESAESLIVMGEEFNRMVENIMEMGYERSQVERALRASFNNPYTAVQYLVDGIPPNLEYNAASQGSNPPSSRQSGEEHEGDDEDDPLDFLRNQPQFNHMRQMIRSNPQLLDAFIQQIGQTNPELLQVIQQNQEAFVRMLNEAPPSSGSAPASGGSTTGSGTGTGTGSTPSSGGQRGASGQNTILVSPQDRDAIERLKALGNFPEDVVIQAYFACEKNENLAAEFLFSQSWD